MPDTENRKARRPLKNLPPDRLRPKVWLIWVAIVAAALTLLYWSPGAANSPANITIEDVIERTQAGEIKSGAIRSDSAGGFGRVVITGEASNPIFLNDRGAKTALFHAEGRLTELNTEKLQK